ncbi:MAG: ATP-binding protein [Candidatus Nanopusillus sp.]
MVYIKDISDIEKLTSADILELFEETKVYRLELNIAWADRTDILKKFINPIQFLKDISQQITNAINSTIDEDYWLLILGEPGTGKSTLSIAFYKYILKNLGYTDDQIKDLVYLDVCYLPYDYLGRIALHGKQIEEKGKPFPHAIVLDEAHNMFDLFAEGSTNIARKLFQRIYEIREWRLAHIINTQIPQQLAKRSRDRFHSLIILWKEPIYIGDKQTKKMEETYLSYTRNILKLEPNKDNISYFLWGAFYGKEQSHKVLRWILRHQLSIEELRPILRRFTPDNIFPMLLLLHESTELRKAYSDIKFYNNRIKTLYDTFGIPRSYRSIFLKVLIELGKNLDKIDPNNITQEGYYKINSPIEIKVRKSDVETILKDIGDIELRTKEIKKDLIAEARINARVNDFISHINEILKTRSSLNLEKENFNDVDYDYNNNLSDDISITSSDNDDSNINIKDILYKKDYYIRISTIHPDIYIFISKMKNILEKRAKLHEAVGFHL